MARVGAGPAVPTTRRGARRGARGGGTAGAAGAAAGAGGAAAAAGAGGGGDAAAAGRSGLRRPRTTATKRGTQPGAAKGNATHQGKQRGKKQPKAQGPARPAALTDMPAPWLSHLASRALLPRDAAVALLRTCRALRDMVLESRRLCVRALVPFRSAEDLLLAQRRLRAACRMSGNVALVLRASRGAGGVDHHDGDHDYYWDGQQDVKPGTQPRWFEVEPSLSHLLLRGMTEQAHALKSVTEFRFVGLELSALIPTWLTQPCPNLRELTAHHCIITVGPHDEQLAPSLPPLTTITWQGCSFWHFPRTPAPSTPLPRAAAESLRQQLALLPSLTRLSVHEWPLAAPSTLHSAHVTKLLVKQPLPPAKLQRLPVQFPNLRKLALTYTTLGDVGMEAVLGLPHLTHLSVFGVSVRRSFVDRACQWQRLSVCALDVDAFARLPLERIESATAARECCTLPVVATTDRSARTRVEQALARWCAVKRGAAVPFWPAFASLRGSAAAVAATVPLLAALPNSLQAQVELEGVVGLAPRHLQRLGRSLPAGVTQLCFTDCTFQPASWTALARLPPQIADINLTYYHEVQPPTAYQLAALCLAAQRPLRVRLAGVTLSSASRSLIRDVVRGVDARKVQLTIDEDFAWSEDSNWMWAESEPEEEQVDEDEDEEQEEHDMFGDELGQHWAYGNEEEDEEQEEDDMFGDELDQDVFGEQEQEEDLMEEDV